MAEKLDFSPDDIDWPKLVPFEEYLNYGREFLELNRNDYYNILNLISLDKVKHLLFHFSFVQYALASVNPSDRVLKSLSLIFFVEGIAPRNGKRDRQRFIDFLVTYLTKKERAYLIDSYQFIKNGAYKPVCYSDNCDAVNCSPNECGSLGDEDLVNYASKVLGRIYDMRCSVVHKGLLSHITGNVFDAYWSKGKFKNYYCKIDFSTFKSLVTSATIKYLQALGNPDDTGR